MGTYGWGRSPYDVQRSNGVRTDFDMAKKRYESIKPLQGKRKELDVRPIGQRNRAWERVVKVSDNEYYLSCISWSYYDKPEHADNARNLRSITLKREGEIDTIIIHASKHSFCSPSVLYFYDFNLPQNMSMYSHKGNKYLKVSTENEGYKYYTLKQGDVIFYKTKGETFWKPQQVFREVRHLLDRKQTKVIREKLKTFTEYARVMLPLVEFKSSWGDILDTHWEDFVTLKNPNEIPESWLDAVARYAYKLNRYNWSTRANEVNEKGLIPKIQRDAYRQAKPFKIEEVPLGELSNDPYKSWV